MPYYPPASGGGGGAIEHLADIGDVAVDANSQILKFHAPNYWGAVQDVPKSFAGHHTSYLSTTITTAVSAQNDILIAGLTDIPTTTAEQNLSFNVPGTGVAKALVAFGTPYGAGYPYLILGGNFLSGFWGINAYLSTDVWVKGTDTARYVIGQAYAIQDGRDLNSGYRVSTSGTGTSRTATATGGGTPFAAGRITASAVATDASFLQTSTGIYQITARTSDTVVTISTPSTYTNLSSQFYQVWIKVTDFGGGNQLIVGSTPSLYSSCKVLAAKPFPSSGGYWPGFMLFGTSSPARTITLTCHGTDHNSHVIFPEPATASALKNTNTSPSYTVNITGNTPPTSQQVLVCNFTAATGQPGTAWFAAIPPAVALKSGDSVTQNIGGVLPVVGQTLVATAGNACSWQTLVPRLTQNTSLSPAVNTLCKQALAGANITVALPATHTAGDIIRVKMTTAAGGNTITIDPNASQTIDGQATYVMSTDYQAVQCESDGANWWTTG